MLLEWSKGEHTVHVGMNGISSRNKISAAIEAIANYASTGRYKMLTDGGPYRWKLEFTNPDEAEYCYFLLIAISEQPMPDGYNPVLDPDNYYMD